MISIPNPCNEDFEKMAPTDRGAYCKVCSTDTFDFRDLSNGEIFQIMEDNRGKHICGRFTKSQLDSLNMPAYYAWKNQTTRTFQSKFLLACLLVFGLGLFSCDNQEDLAEIDNIQVKQVLNTVEPQTAFVNGRFDLEDADLDLLDYIVEAPVEICEIETAGVIHEQVIQDTVYYIDEDYVLGGAIAMTDYHIIENYQVVQPEIDTAEVSILSDQTLIDPRLFEATAYPNPTQDMSTVAIDVANEGQFQIMMYNMNGQLVTSIYSGHLVEGRQTFEVDMYELNSGMYIVKVISQGQDETLKIQKLN